MSRLQGLPPVMDVRTRLLVEAAIVGLVILSTGYYLDHVGGLIPVFDLRLGLLGIPVTIIAVIGLMNAFNMMDGIDGLAASTAMVSIAGLLAWYWRGCCWCRGVKRCLFSQHLPPRMFTLASRHSPRRFHPASRLRSGLSAETTRALASP